MNKTVKAELTKLKKSYSEIAVKYNEALLSAVKEMLTNTFHIPQGEGMNIKEFLDDGIVDIPAKYETPKDHAANYVLFGFCIDKSGKLAVKAYDIEDSDCEWTFSEYDFTISELSDILSILEAIEEEIENGNYILDEDLCVVEKQSIL